MEQIVLNANLTLLLDGLTAEDKGRLLEALLANNDERLDGQIRSLYRYIMLQQEELAAKKRHMRELGAKGGAARRKSLAAANNASATPIKRKVTKENKSVLNKKHNLFILNSEKTGMATETFEPPTIQAVRSFAKAEKLNIDAETFVDFYESRGWRVGQTAIQNWQAVARLWHRRTLTSENTPSSSDESYWKELSARTADISLQKEDITSTSLQTTEDQPSAALSHFAQFMRRIERNDIQTENKDE